MTWRKYAAWEASLLKKFNWVVMPTDEDKQRMQQYDPSVKNILVILNAADTEYYDIRNWSPAPRVLLYNGALTYGPNLNSVLFYKEKIYPILRQRYPVIQLLVTGRYDGIIIDALTIQDASSYVKELFQARGKSLKRIASAASYNSMRKDSAEFALIPPGSTPVITYFSPGA